MYGLSCRIAVISLGRLRYHDAAGQILCQTGDLIREAGDVLLADVSQQQVDQVVACLGLGALRGASDTAAVQGLVQVSHLDQLVLNVGSLGEPAISPARAVAPIRTSPTPTLQPP